MQEILKKIVLQNGFDSIYELGDKKSYLIIKDRNWDASDFFFFLFLEELPTDIAFEEYFKEFWWLRIKEWDGQELSTFPSFDKNTNLIIFMKVEDDLMVNDHKKGAYQIEEDPYFFRKKIIFYTQNQIDDFNNYSLSLEWFSEVQEDIKDAKKRFLLNLLVWLSFIKVRFDETQNSNDRKSIFQESFDEINTDSLFFLWNNYEDLNKKIEDIYRKIHIEETVNPHNLTEFESVLLSLFPNNDKTQEESSIL